MLAVGADAGVNPPVALKKAQHRSYLGRVRETIASLQLHAEPGGDILVVRRIRCPQRLSGKYRLAYDVSVECLDRAPEGNVNFIPNFAPISGALVQNNFLGANMGSAYCTYGGEKSTSPTPHSDHIVYKDNVFQRGTNLKCAAYGPVTDFNVNGAGNVWTNNKWEDGQPIDPEN